MSKYPFEVDYSVVEGDPEPFISAVFSCLESEFLFMPRGQGFVDYGTFEAGYEGLKKATDGFCSLSADRLLLVIQEHPIALVVLRTILGFTPPEWAYVTTRRTDVEVPQGFARTLDRDIRIGPLNPLRKTPAKWERLQAMLSTACGLIEEGAADKSDDARIHRLEKADTQGGQESLRRLARLGVPYAMLLYERFLGRPPSPRIATP